MFTFLFFFIILDRKSLIKIKRNLLQPIFIYGIAVHSTVYGVKVVFWSWNGLKLFALILMGKIVSDFEQITFRTAFWNGLCSKTEVCL